MRFRTILYVITVIIVGVLALANWEVMMQPVTLNVLVARVLVPLWALLLAPAVVILLIDLLAYGLNRRAWARERQDLTNQIHTLRARADSVEESRIQSLREAMERETAIIRAQLDRLLVANRSAVASGEPVNRREAALVDNGDRVV